MYKGTQKIDVAIHANVIVTADAPFMCYELDSKKERTKVLGPFNGALIHRFKLSDDCDAFEVKTKADTHYEVTWSAGKPRYPSLDPTPLEMPAGMKQPDSLEKTLQRLVRSEMLRAQYQAAGDMDSPDEYDDFEFDDDEELYSEQDIEEMQTEKMANEVRKSEENERKKDKVAPKEKEISVKGESEEQSDDN